MRPQSWTAGEVLGADFNPDGGDYTEIRVAIPEHVEVGHHRLVLVKHDEWARICSEAALAEHRRESEPAS